MKRIWLINQYAMPPHLESRLRTIKFAQYLSEAGYDVTIFASSIMHNMDINLIEDGSLFVERQYGNLKFVHINTRAYKANGINRLIGLIQFPLRLMRVAKLFKTPDIIVQTATVPFGNLLYYLAKRTRAKYIVEVLDLWPESLVDLGMIRKSNPLLKIAYWAEKWQYNKAQDVVFSMEGGEQYIKDKGWDYDNNGPINLQKVHYINNGVDLADFDYYAKNFRIDDVDLENDSKRKVIYIGSIRLANNLKHLIDAAQILKHHSDIVFILYGDGDDRPLLEEYCSNNGIRNVVFKDKWVEPKYVPYILTKSDVNILNYKQGSFGAYGGSQSKMFQYMASGKPICCNLEMMFCPIKKNNIGISSDFKNADEYADAIYTLTNLSFQEKEEIKERSRKAVQDFNYPVLTQKLINLFH